MWTGPEKYHLYVVRITIDPVVKVIKNDAANRISFATDCKEQCSLKVTNPRVQMRGMWGCHTPNNLYRSKSLFITRKTSRISAGTLLYSSKIYSESIS